MKKHPLKMLAHTISSMMALFALSTQSVKAADTEIYQASKKGTVTLMLVLDVSGSMHQCDTDTRTIPGGARIEWSTCQHNGQTLDSRFSLVKKAMQDLLKGNPSKNIEALDDDKVIGLATLGAGGYTGEVLIPAKPLGSKTDPNSHRYVLLRRIENLKANSWTPTAYSYAEVASYLMGTSTKNTYDAFNRTPKPNNYHWQISGFNRSAANTKNAAKTAYQSPSSLTQKEEDKQCNGQGIYMLTDGEPNHGRMAETIMKESLGNKPFSCGIPSGNGNPDYSTGWDCIHKYSQALLDRTKNPKDLQIKTAVVGFGRVFTTVLTNKYDPTKSQEDNIAALGNLDHDAKKAAYWGIIGKGGWYAGSKSQDVVDSVNHFIASLTADIPNVATGQPFIPIDPLDPLTRMSDAYYGAFTPKVGSTHSFWVGDMNKYKIKNQILYGKNNKSLFNATSGLVNTDAIGFWSNDSGSQNGMTALLPLKTAGRPVFTNPTAGKNIALTKVTLDSLFDTGGALVSDTVNRNAWLNILGYNVDLTGTVTSKTAPEISSTAPELRQIGAVMHSTPIVLTQKGAAFSGDDRTDFILFGSTQGILHVVDSKTGVEKVAFVPKEMMANQKENFQSSEKTVSSRGLFYGVDGQWVAHTQYVNDATSGVTVKGSDTPKTSSDLSGKGVQWVYGGLRMGGRSYYGLDLSDLDEPKIKFHIDPASAAANSPLSFMGQSWSKPTLGFVNWEGEYFNPTTNTIERAIKPRLVMFVGGGYDAGYESRTYDQTNGVGGGVYMFDAHNGELLWWASAHPNTSTTAKYTNNANLKYSVVSNISTFDRNNDGLVDNLIFGDLGGQVFRVDLDNSGAATPANRVVRLYNGHQAGGLSPRFYEAPSLSAHKQAGIGTFGVISVASGNRSSPLAEGTESARDLLVALFDQDILKGTATVTDVSTDSLEDLTSKKMNADIAEPQMRQVMAKGGWKYYLSGVSGKRKGFSSPRVVDNFLFLTTYTPNGGTVQKDSCNAGIVGVSYQELFCMPWGICNEKQQKLLGSPTHDESKDGSNYQGEIGVGIVQTEVGTKDPNGNPSTKQGLIGPKIDCTANPTSPLCLTEVSSIANKPTRWYEDVSKN